MPATATRGLCTKAQLKPKTCFALFTQQSCLSCVVIDRVTRRTALLGGIRFKKKKQKKINSILCNLSRFFFFLNHILSRTIRALTLRRCSPSSPNFFLHPSTNIAQELACESALSWWVEPSHSQTQLPCICLDTVESHDFRGSLYLSLSG